MRGYNWKRLRQTDIMYFNSYGCEGWADYSRVIQHNGTSVVAETTPPCRHESFSFASVMYFLIYILISAFLVLNLFIGVIVSESPAQGLAWGSYAAKLTFPQFCV